MSTPRLSPAMRNMLRGILAGKTPYTHLVGKSRHGGAVQTLQALRTRGLVDEENRPTDAGRSVFTPAQPATRTEATPC